MNKIPKGCKSIKLINYKKAKIDASLEHVGIHTVRLSGEHWAVFINSFQAEDITTLCFSMLKKSTFEVCCFNIHGFELRSHNSGEDAIYSCLVKATENTFVQQDLAPVFLWQLTHTERRNRIQKVRISGSNQDSNVDVVYVGIISNNKRGEAAGFGGPNWTTFCLENEVQPGYYMRFSNLGNYNFNFQVFNNDGIGLDMPVSHAYHSVPPVE